MKITKIEPMVVGAPTPGNGQLSNKNYIFVKVYTDEGVAGIGEASLGGYTNTIVALIGELEELLIGEDPTRIEYLCQVMQRQKFWRGGNRTGALGYSRQDPRCSGLPLVRRTLPHKNPGLCERLDRRSDRSRRNPGPSCRSEGVGLSGI